jgi:Tfp pilus assembly PilM family ATPase
MVQRFVRGWRQAPVCLGLSIHDQRMTLVEWHAAGAAQPSVQRWVQEEWMPSAEPAPGLWDEPARMGATLGRLWQRAGMQCRRLAVGLPADRVVLQTLQVEADCPANELRAQVNWRASQALGLNWDEVAFDYRTESPDGPLTVHWLACPMALVHAAQLMSRAARLHLQFVGVEPAHMGLRENQQGGAPALLPQLQMACEMARQGSQS